MNNKKNEIINNNGGPGDDLKSKIGATVGESSKKSESPAGNGNGILAKAHEESLSSLTGISLSGEDANIIVLALPSNFIFYIKRIFIPLIILGALLSVYFLSGIFILFFISFFFAYVINPLVLIVERYLKNKTISILTVYLVLFALLMALIIPAITNITSEISNLGNKMQKYSETFKGMYNNFSKYLTDLLNSPFLKEIEEFLQKFIEPPSGDGNSSKEHAHQPEINGGSRQDDIYTDAGGYEKNLLAAYIPTGEVMLSNTSEISVRYITHLNYFLKNNPKKIEAFIMSFFETLKGNIADFSSYLLMGLMNLTVILFRYALVPLLGYYYLSDFKNLWLGFQNSIPAKFKKQTVKLVEQLDEVLGTFLRGQLVICLIVGTGFSIALYLIDVDFAVIIGSISGIFNIIYYLGPAMAMIPSVLIAILKWGFTYKALYKIIFIVVSILIIHLIDAFIFQPFIAEKSFKMHPLTLMFLLFIGLQFYGLIGMFIAIPLYGVGKVVYKSFKIVYV
jgi:predicted PurR-regulated permease PerM